MVFHVLAAIAVLLTNYLLKVNRTDWLITLMLTGLAWMAELFNTAIETLANRVTREQDPLIGRAKDLASGAVLTICIFAVICAVVVYWPYVVG
jgi:diacylglycerol kinase